MGWAMAVFLTQFALGITAPLAAERSGQDIVKEVSDACHKQGQNGAPAIGTKN